MAYETGMFLLRVVLPIILLGLFSWVVTKFIDRNKK
jgi:hypothetical protein